MSWSGLAIVNVKWFRAVILNKVGNGVWMGWKKSMRPLMAAEAMVSQSESGPRYAFGLPAIFYSKRVGWTEWTESGPSLPAFWYSKRVVDRGTRGSVIILRCV